MTAQFQSLDPDIFYSNLENMALISFSQKYPSHHYRKGDRTAFASQILNYFGVDFKALSYLEKLAELNAKKLDDGKITMQHLVDFQKSMDKHSFQHRKLHTARSRNRWKAGDTFSPVVWTAQPYYSPQIIFWEPIVIKATENMSFDKVVLDTWVEKKILQPKVKGIFAKNDGFFSMSSVMDMENWFQKDVKKEPIFHGQIIHWSDEVRYGSI